MHWRGGLEGARDERRFVEKIHILNELKGISEALAELVERLGEPPGLERAARDPVEDPHVIEPAHVIGMRVRIKNSVDLADSIGKELSAEIGAGIDQEMRLPAHHHDRGAGPPVARLGGITHPPVAAPIRPADQRHARRATRAQHHHPHHAPSPSAASPMRGKRRAMLRRICRASASGATPLISASFCAVWTMKAGSFRLPLSGTGAR